MQSLGVQLRLERERQKLELSLIAEETRINLGYLEAIEADDLEALPGDFFYRSFVRQYSKFLGLNPNETEKLVQGGAGSSGNIGGSSAVAPPTLGGYAAHPKSAEEGNLHSLRHALEDKPIRPPQEENVSRNWLVIAAILIAATGAYFAWRNFTPPMLATPNVADSSKTSPSPTSQPPASQPEANPQTAPPGESANAVGSNPAATEGTVAPTEGAVAVPPVSAAATPPVTPTVTPTVTTPSAGSVSSGSGPVSVTVIAKEVTWVRLTADGRKIFGGTIDPGQQRTISGTDIEIIVGNAGTLDVVFQGKPLSYGTKGQVKTLLFTPEGWKLKAKPAPSEGTASMGGADLPRKVAAGSSPADGDLMPFALQ